MPVSSELHYGSLVVIDSSASDIGTMISSSGSSTILENISNSGTTLQINGNTVLTGSVGDTWVYGHYVSFVKILNTETNNN